MKRKDLYQQIKSDHALMRWWQGLEQAHPDMHFFLKYFFIFFLFFLSIASLSLLTIISKESNPFFYANF